MAESNLSGIVILFMHTAMWMHVDAKQKEFTQVYCSVMALLDIQQLSITPGRCLWRQPCWSTSKKRKVGVSKLTVDFVEKLSLTCMLQISFDSRKWLLYFSVEVVWVHKNCVVNTDDIFDERWSLRRICSLIGSEVSSFQGKQETFSSE